MLCDSGFQRTFVGCLKELPSKRKSHKLCRKAAVFRFMRRNSVKIVRKIYIQLDTLL